jgi:GAF domain-containing protein
MDQAAPGSNGFDSPILGRAAESVQELIDHAQVEFGCGVGLDDVDLQAIAYSRQPEKIDDVRRESILRRTTTPEVSRWLRQCGIWEATKTIQIPANRKLGMFGRLCAPVQWSGKLLGFLWLDDTEADPDGGRQALISIYAGRIAAALAHERFLEQRERIAEADAVRRLVRGESLPPSARSNLAGTDVYVAVALCREFDSSLAREATESQIRAGFEDLQRRLAPRPVIGLVENAEGVLVIGGAHDGAPQLRADFEQMLGRLSAGDVRIGISQSREDLAALSEAYREARWSAEAAAADGTSNCVSWGSLGAGRTLFKLLSGRPVEKLLPANFARLREVDGGDMLVATLETYLEAGCDSKATAAAFSIHRSTLYQRLRRIEEVSGLDLKKGDDRLDLHLGLRLLRLGNRRGEVLA